MSARAAGQVSAPAILEQEALPASSGKIADLRFVLSQARPRAGLIAAALALSLVEVAATLSFPILTGGIVDRLGRAGFGGGSLLADQGLFWLCAVLLCAALAGATGRYLLARSGLGMVARLKVKLAGQLLQAPVSDLEKSASGELTSRVMNDSRTLSQLMTRELLNVVSGTLLLVGTGIVLFSLDLRLASILFGMIGLAFLVSLPVIMALSRVAFRQQEVTARLSARLTQLFAEVRLIKAFGTERQETETVNREADSLYQLGLRNARTESFLQPLISLTVTAALISIMAYGGVRVAAGTLSAGTLTAFLLYIFSVVGPLAQLSSFASQLASAKGASSRMAQVLRLPVEDEAQSPQMPVRQAASPGRSALEFLDLEFAYPGTDATVLKIDHLAIAAGSKTAIIGPSGCGKSTLMALIERFHAPAKGRILSHGQDIARLQLQDWRSRIGYVAQNAAILEGTIRDNVLYGVGRQVAAEELDRALCLARCDEFIARLDGGLDAAIGERGLNLSGGQRQRIAIARMFLRDPEILLLDEATSQLDEENEYQVVQALQDLMATRTSLIVTHRLRLVEDMDRIVLMQNGRIVASGDHHSLLADNSEYRRTVQREFELEGAQ